MKQKIDFYLPIDGPKYRITGNMNTLSKLGHNGYKIKVWEHVSYEDQKPLAEFAIELNGELYESSNEHSKDLFEKEKLGEAIISEAQISN